MLRAVLGVALAAALIAAVTPALEDARTTRTDRLAARELGRVESAANSLVREESPGARRTLEISLPGESPTTAPVAFVAFGGLPDDIERRTVADTADGDVLAYRTAGGSVTVRRVGVDLRVGRDGERAGEDERAFVLSGGESYRLTLQLVQVQGRPTVVVDALEVSTSSGPGKPPPLAVCS